MKALTQELSIKDTAISGIFDVLGLAFIYFVPAISHLLSLPIYLIEPMRLMMILAIVHTKKINVYTVALTLPIFSFIVSAHPVFPKMILIFLELYLNAFLFYVLKDRFRSIFLSAFSSIIISKLAYYAVKAILISTAIINTELISTPIIIQIITTLLYSVYIMKFYNSETNQKI